MTRELISGFLDGAGCPSGGAFCWGWVVGAHTTSVFMGLTLVMALCLGFFLGRWRE